MNKRLMLCLIWLFYFTNSNAQSFSPSSVVPAGGENETENMSLEWTIGQIFTYTIDHPNGILTQGSHQPILHVELPLSNNTTSANSELNILIYPNPVQQILTVDISSEDNNRKLVIELFDLNGKKLIETVGNAANDLLNIDMGHLPTGLYLLRFNDAKGMLLQTYQITKVDDH